MIDLKTERMIGKGPGGSQTFTGFQPNYLFGLDDLCRKFVDPECRVLEIGCNRGISTELFASYAKSVTAVDIKLKPRMANLLKRTSNIRFTEAFSTDYLKRLVEGDFDLVYLDGDHAHKTVVKELRLVLTRLKKDFVLAGHDMYPSTRKKSQVQKAVHEVLPGIHEGDLIIHRFSDSSWAVVI